MAAGAVSLRKSHDIVILSFCNIVKGQANYPEYDDVRTYVNDVVIYFLTFFTIAVSSFRNNTT